MKEQIERRLALSGWQLSVATSIHSLWFKRDWQCDINRNTGQIHFSRRMKTAHLMREIEEGIE